MVKSLPRGAIRLILLVQAILAGLAGTCGAEALAPPFGLKWGDPPARLVDWAIRTGLDQLVKAPASDPRLKILVVSSAEGNLPDHEASSLEARFIDGRLFEVTIHYKYPGRPADFVRGQFVKLKGLLARQHGSFKPAGQKRVGPEEGIETRSSAYRIDPSADLSLTLVLTEVTDTLRADAAAQFSVVYHNSVRVEEEGERGEIRREGEEAPPASEEP